MKRHRKFRKLTRTISRKPYAYCNDCGRRINFSEDCVWAYPISIYAANGDFSSKYAEPVCDDCIDKSYVECAECGYYHHKACCTQTDEGWICDVCEVGSSAPTWQVLFKRSDMQ